MRCHVSFYLRKRFWLRLGPNKCAKAILNNKKCIHRSPKRGLGLPLGPLGWSWGRLGWLLGHLGCPLERLGRLWGRPGRPLASQNGAKCGPTIHLKSRLIFEQFLMPSRTQKYVIWGPLDPRHRASRPHEVHKSTFSNMYDVFQHFWPQLCAKKATKSEPKSSQVPGARFGCPGWPPGPWSGHGGVQVP